MTRIRVVVTFVAIAMFVVAVSIVDVR